MMNIPEGYRPNVALVTMHDGKILLVHKPRLNDAWQFPQGGVDDGETGEEAARREFHEELGTDRVRILKKSIHTYSYDFPTGYGRFKDTQKSYKGQFQSFYLAEFLGDRGEIKLHPEELDDHCWIEPAKIGDYIKRPEYLATSRKVLQEFGLL